MLSFLFSYLVIYNLNEAVVSKFKEQRKKRQIGVYNQKVTICKILSVFLEKNGLLKLPGEIARVVRLIEKICFNLKYKGICYYLKLFTIVTGK